MPFSFFTYSCKSPSPPALGPKICVNIPFPCENSPLISSTISLLKLNKDNFKTRIAVLNEFSSNTFVTI